MTFRSSVYTLVTPLDCAHNSNAYFSMHTSAYFCIPDITLKRLTYTLLRSSVYERHVAYDSISGYNSNAYLIMFQRLLYKINSTIGVLSLNSI